MKKILTIIGARPQIIKAAAISREIQNNFSSELEEIIVHTGQHYDENMSQIFFDELKIPKPNYNLKIGSGSHAGQTAEMLKGIEEILEKERPNYLLIYGDTNSTVAGSLAASKIHIPVIHIEAGLRSFNKSMPEEINRIMSDHVSSMLFCPTDSAIENLKLEGFDYEPNPITANIDQPAVIKSGDIMLDNTLHFKEVAEEQSNIMKENDLVKEQFILTTCHRPSNTDDSNNINSIFQALYEIAEENEIKVVLPIHPRTQKCMDELLDKELKSKINSGAHFIIIPPVSFLEMIQLEANSKMIISDSGGVQKEAFFLKKPCVVLREETEWIELIDNGNAMLVGPNKGKILAAFRTLSNKEFTYPSFYGNGNAANQICKDILALLN